LYSEVKDNKLHRFYSSLFFLRRALITLVIISGSLGNGFIPVRVRGVTYLILQLIPLLFKCGLPFKHLRDNAIEIINDAILIGLSLTFTIWQDQDTWDDDTITDIVITILTLNGMFINITIIIDFWIQVVIWFKSQKCDRHNKVKTVKKGSARFKIEAIKKLRDPVVIISKRALKRPEDEEEKKFDGEPTTSKNTPRLMDSWMGESNVSHMDIYDKNPTSRVNTDMKLDWS